MGYSPWGYKQPEMTERLTLSLSLITHITNILYEGMGLKTLIGDLFLYNKHTSAITMLALFLSQIVSNLINKVQHFILVY